MNVLAGGSSVELEYRVIPGDGTDIRDVWVKGRPFYDDEGELISLAGFVRDITDQKRYRRQLKEFNRLLSHDLKNQLQVATGFLQAAEEDCSNMNLKRVEKALKRMNEMTTDILTLPQPDRDRIERDIVTLRELEASSWEGLDREDAELHVDGDVTLQVASGLFRNVLENLFRNAIVHNDDPVAIHIGPLYEEGGFYVEDNGTGIPVAEQIDIFQVGNSTGRHGLGLPLSNEIIIAHGGSISIRESDLGGARFDITGVSPSQNAYRETTGDECRTSADTSESQ